MPNPHYDSDSRYRLAMFEALKKKEMDLALHVRDLIRQALNQRNLETSPILPPQDAIPGFDLSKIHPDSQQTFEETFNSPPKDLTLILEWGPFSFDLPGNQLETLATGTFHCSEIRLNQAALGLSLEYSNQTLHADLQQNRSGDLTQEEAVKVSQLLSGISPELAQSDYNQGQLKSGDLYSQLLTIMMKVTRDPEIKPRLRTREFMSLQEGRELIAMLEELYRQDRPLIVGPSKIMMTVLADGRFSSRENPAGLYFSDEPGLRTASFAIPVPIYDANQAEIGWTMDQVLLKEKNGVMRFVGNTYDHVGYLLDEFSEQKKLGLDVRFETERQCINQATEFVHSYLAGEDVSLLPLQQEIIKLDNPNALRMLQTLAILVQKLSVDRDFDGTTLRIQHALEDTAGSGAFREQNLMLFVAAYLAAEVHQNTQTEAEIIRQILEDGAFLSWSSIEKFLQELIALNGAIKLFKKN